VAVLLNPDEQVAEPAYQSVHAAAQRHAVSLIRVPARTTEEIAQAFVTMKEERSQAIVVTGGAFFVQRRTQLADLAAKTRLPAVYYRREYVEAGGLMSYGRNAAIAYRRAAAYVDKILKGSKPEELPVEQPSVIELVINRKAAKALGVSFPPQVLVRADKIID
jgi:putative ABC transport system substrate-binding protein